jgi:hypothetical protein
LRATKAAVDKVKAPEQLGKVSGFNALPIFADKSMPDDA